MPRLRTALLAVAGAGVAVAHRRSRGRDDRHLRHVWTLDPERDHAEIAHYGSAYEFPWDTETALSLALFRTFAVPTISRILLDTGAFTDATRKRYDDTELLLAEVEQHGYDHPRGKEALRRVNRMHAAYPIRDVDMTYTLSTFVFEPRRFIDAYGWRALSDYEIRAGWRYWHEVGARMGVHDVPDDLDEFDAWNREFEAREFRYDPANHTVADATLTMYLTEVYGVPQWLLPLARSAVLALLEPALVAALGYPPPPRWLRTAVPAVLRTRGRLQRWFVPPRSRPHRITEVPRPTYPAGYRLKDLGTTPDPATARRAGERGGVLPAEVPRR